MASPALAADDTKEGAVCKIDLEDDYNDNLNEKKKGDDHGESAKDGLVAAPQSVTSTSPDPPSLSESESYVPTEVPTPYYGYQSPSGFDYRPHKYLWKCARTSFRRSYPGRHGLSTQGG